MKKIPVSEPLIEREEIENVLQAIKSGFISGSGGEFIKMFEKEFTAFCNAKYGITTSSGTAALHLAVRALGIGPGDEVITTNFTNIATLLGIIYAGARPVVVDCEKDTWNLDVSQIEAKINKNTKALLPVHIYGHPVDMDPLLELAERHDLKVIEDAAEAHGALYKGRKTGCLGDIG